MPFGVLPPDGALATLLREGRPIAEIAVLLGLPLDLVEEFRASFNADWSANLPPVSTDRTASHRHWPFNLAASLVAAACLLSAIGFYAVRGKSTSRTTDLAAAAGEVTLPSPCLVMWQGATPMFVPGAANTCELAGR